MRGCLHCSLRAGEPRFGLLEANEQELLRVPTDRVGASDACRFEVGLFFEAHDRPRVDREVAEFVHAARLELEGYTARARDLEDVARPRGTVVTPLAELFAEAGAVALWFCGTRGR